MFLKIVIQRILKRLKSRFSSTIKTPQLYGKTIEFDNLATTGDIQLISEHRRALAETIGSMKGRMVRYRAYAGVHNTKR